MEYAKLLIIFATVLKYGSMNASASHLGMTASAISQHIKRLEELYQIKLLNRTTRKLIPTEAGKTLWQYAQQLTELLEQTENAMQNLREEAVGEVKITLPTAYMQMPIMHRIIQRLRSDFPAIRLVFLESDKVVNLLDSDTADIAIRVMHQTDDENLIARPLATWQTLLCASPDYLSQHPINKPQDLLSAHWLNFHNGALLNTLNQLNLPAVLPDSRTDCTHNANSARDLARLGLGVTILMSGDIAEDLRSGRLVQLLPDYPLPMRTIYAVTVNRAQSAKIRTVLEVLAEEFKKG